MNWCHEQDIIVRSLASASNKDKKNVVVHLSKPSYQKNIYKNIVNILPKLSTKLFLNLSLKMSLKLFWNCPKINHKIDQEIVHQKIKYFIYVYVPVGISNSECINTLWNDSS